MLYAFWTKNLVLFCDAADRASNVSAKMEVNQLGANEEKGEVEGDIEG